MTNVLPSSGDLLAFLPEILLVMAIAGVLITPMVLRKWHLLSVPIVATLGLGVAWLSLFLVRGRAVGSPAAYFGGMLLLDPFSWALKLLLIGFALVIMALWFSDSHDKFITRELAKNTPEFFAMLLSATLGLCLMVDSTNLLVLFVAMETAALPIYVLVGFRTGHRPAAEAGMKFLLTSAVAAALMAYGMSLIYGVCGSLDLREIGAIFAQKEMHLRMTGTAGVIFALGMAGLLAGVGFKIAMVPMHFWSPEVFEKTGIDVATFLSVASVAAGLAVLMRVLGSLTGASGASGPLWWLATAMLVLGSITCICGSLGAFWQTNIKRLLAWSGMAHAGFMLIGMSSLILPATQSTSGTAPHPAEMFTSPAGETLLFYLLMFLFMNGGAFISAAAIAQRLTGPTDAGMSLGVDRIITPIPSRPPSSENDTGEDLQQYAGLFRRAPILSAIMLTFLLSLAGFPLTAGFGAKMKLLATLFYVGGAAGWTGIAVIAITTVILAFSYFRVVRQMYLTDSDAPRLIEIAPVTIVALVLAVPNLAFFAGYGLANDQAQQHAAMLAPASMMPQTAPP